MRYEFAEGFKAPATPSVVGKELERLKEKYDGRLKPEILVAEARHKTSPLHPCFEWNNDKAAEQFRLLQAERLIVSVRVIIEEREEKVVRVNILTDRKSVV